MIVEFLLLAAFILLLVDGFLTTQPTWSRLVTLAFAAWVLAEFIIRAPGAFHSPGLW